ncbi:capsule polysaccharide biosynthesis [Novosphingobium nitrogenifigens DSM 19370]|uniref:Capsule polysaccharide biosynthesis n=1 Tax=Novosphingobium nitrogenifigens DSM 19370 TaxID=983920 RepID=F1Z6F4_9SPHN|nr:capsular biosynthesis protein [Novosphingobium nitrogenifigens]EGD59936.1 capsule polysaccharide biosynthesis [Novosphingobium nitrogenifigens DSM 19370]
MIEGGIKAFAGRKVLLLQGPVGPFFARFAKDLRAAGADVRKINFHGGDWLFQPNGTLYRGTMEDWPEWLAARIAEWDIDMLFLFGDCRPVHRAAHDVATRLGVEVGVFEEGYLRPDFVTLERHGVNGNSLLPRDPADYLASPPRQIDVRAMPRSFWPMVWWGFLYFTIGGFTHGLFPHYRHHRPLTIREMFPWLRSPLRKARYALRERGMTARMTGEWSGRFFLVPLQVHNDAQVQFHADVGGVTGFIVSTILSFARHAPADAVLVFKHHPMDRGYCDYTALIGDTARDTGCTDRIAYIHDQHMPTILPHCRGMVVINSTTGLAAIGCGRPTKTVGTAIYDMPGMTFQGSLDRFWTEATDHRPDPVLYERFRAELIAATQINGNFYRRLDPATSASGLIWTIGGARTTDSRPAANHDARPQIIPAVPTVRPAIPLFPVEGLPVPASLWARSGPAEVLPFPRRGPPAIPPAERPRERART